MHKSNLILHCGAAKVERGALELVPTPVPTESWQPIGHFELLEQVEKALASRKLSIVSEAHGLTANGNRYFGLLQISSEKLGDQPDYGYCVGLRNSHDRRFPVSLAVGASVFICDNLAFSSEITAFRRHTVYVRRDLPNLMARAVAQLSSKWNDQHKRFDVYKQHELSDPQAHDLLIRALDCKAVTTTQIPHILNEWRAPRHPEFVEAGKTAWRFFNSCTEIAKDGGLWSLAPRTEALHGLLDQEVGVSFSRN
jgi:Domain of unknown function (DUF932)